MLTLFSFRRRKIYNCQTSLRLVILKFKISRNLLNQIFKVRRNLTRIFFSRPNYYLLWKYLCNYRSWNRYTESPCFNQGYSIFTSVLIINLNNIGFIYPFSDEKSCPTFQTSHRTFSRELSWLVLLKRMVTRSKRHATFFHYKKTNQYY